MISQMFALISFIDKSVQAVSWLLAASSYSFQSTCWWMVELFLQGGLISRTILTESGTRRFEETLMKLSTKQSVQLTQGQHYNETRWTREETDTLEPYRSLNV